MVRTDMLWLAVGLVGLCAFFYALNATVMARFDAPGINTWGPVSAPWLLERREMQA